MEGADISRGRVKEPRREGNGLLRVAWRRHGGVNNEHYTGRVEKHKG